MNRLKRKQVDRPRAFWGALISTGVGIANALINSSNQKKQRQLQANLEDYNNSLREVQGMTDAFNSAQDYQQNYLQQFKQQARLGTTKRLGSRNIIITDGGNATKIGNNTYLLRGGSHEQTNETGQTGIGINVGGNEIEAEGGEVAQKKNDALRIFSAQPILDNGMSPAQAILRGYNKDKVFNAQQAFKRRNGLKDDGGKAQIGGYYGANYPSPLSLLSILYDKTLGRFDDKNPNLQTGIAPTPSRSLNLKQVRSGLVNRNMLRTNRVYRIANMREVKDAKAIGQYRKLPEGVTLPTKTVRTRTGRTFEFGKAGGNSHGGKAAAMGEPWTGTTSGGYNESKYVISTPSRHTVWQVGHHGSYSKPLPADAIKKGSGLWKKFDAEGNTGISTKRMVVYKDLGNGRYLRLAKSKYRLGGGLTSKDRDSSKHPYPSVSSKDFAGGGRSYPIPTKADAVDALRLAGLHGRSDVKAKVYSRYPELRKKAEMGTIVYDGIPGTDSYRQRMYSGYNASPLALLNILNYLDRAAGFVNENGNSKYITGIAPTPGIRGRSKILSDINKTNKVARRASISRYFNSRQYHIQPNRIKVSKSAIPVERYSNGRYTYQGQFKQWQQGTPYSQTGYPNSHITVSTEPNDAIRGNVGSWWSDFKTRMDLKSQAKQKRNNIIINNRLHKQEIIDRLRRIKAASKQSKFINDLNNYSNEQLGAMRPDSYWDKQMGRFINLSNKVSNVKEIGKYALTAGAIGAGASLYGLSRIKLDNNSNNNNNNVTQKDAKGKPISPYIAKPTANNNIISNKQTPVKKQVTGKSITTKKPVVVSKTSKPVSKKLYGLNDNETKVINGQTYVRRGNQVFNTTTKVRYDYSNGKYTGHKKVYGIGDYSHIGKNFNDAFDAARAAGASIFKYNAGKYNQYNTAKENNVKKERLNRIIGSKRIAKKIGGFVLRSKARIGGSWKAPIYNTKKYRVSNRMRQQIATWEGSDFAGQNRKFNGDAIGAKERELRQMMGKTYNYLTDNQRDSLNSIYYNSRVDTFKNRFGKWFRNLNDAVDRGDERAFNNSLAGIRQSMTIGENRQGMSGLAKRRAWERNWFGNPIPMDSNETKAILKQQAEARMVQPTDNTRVVIQPEYIEVPAPVGHGIVPVDNPDPNLLQGDIKYNLINMGNKFRLGQRCGGKTRMRCGGKTRMRKALGCESRPVKGMRSKCAWGDVVYPYRRNNNFDYWDIIDQEQKSNDKGGISPWTTSNKYDVKVPYAITKITPTIPYTSQVSTPTSKVTENKTIPTYIGNKSGMILRDADWASLGADLIGTIGAGIIGAKAAGNIYIPKALVPYQASKLSTNYNITPQLEAIKRSRNRLANEISNNTSSSVAAINRLNLLENNANEQINKLYNTKENRESELLNQDALNQQSVSAQNVQAMNDYNYRLAELKNARTQAMGNVLSGTLQGIGNSFQNFISQGRQNYDDTQAMLMGVAASDYATPSRLLELGVDVGDDAALAGIYRSAMNIPNPGARPKREDYSDNTEYSYALTRWENQNKAYQRRNSYADLIKGRMSKKNLIKYGII